MIILDTIAFTTFIDLINDETARENHSLKKDEFVKFITDYEQTKAIHGATLFEIYIKGIKKDSYSSTNTFSKYYNYLNRYNIKILNDSSYYFDWKSLLNASYENKEYDIFSYISQKVDFERISIKRYFVYFYTIISETFFEKYEDRVGHDLFPMVNILTESILDAKLNEYLLEYYSNNQNKELITKKFDLLLGYLISKFEIVIKDQLTILPSEKFPDLSLEELYEDQKLIILDLYSDCEHPENLKISGVAEAKKKLNGLTKKNIKQLISSTIDTIESSVKKSHKRCLTPTEKSFYQYILLPKALHQGYKVSKNDFTDCLIAATFDSQNSNEDCTIITFDKNLKSFLKEHTSYYNESIYNQVFN